MAQTKKKHKPKQKQPQQQQGPVIPLWSNNGRQVTNTNRSAQFWRKADGKAVECVLCYKNCVIEPGQQGWCKYRANHNGTMTIPEHGILTTCQKQILGYRGGIRTYCVGLPSVNIGATRCSASCLYCTSDNVVWNPQKIQWLGDRERGPGTTAGWDRTRAMMHPLGVIDLAKQWGCGAVTLATNEPLLSFEMSYDIARLAKQAGLKVVLYTNGFSTPDVVRKIGKYVDAVDLGIKGSLSEAFYSKWMRSPGGTDAVKQSLLAWKETGVHLMISSLIATPHQQSDEEYEQTQAEMYDWIASNLGEHTPILVGHMHSPDGAEKWYPYLVKQTVSAYQEYKLRLDFAYEQAQEMGLWYAHTSHEREEIHCHNCKKLLFTLNPPERQCSPCILFETFCNCWNHTQYITADSKCKHCGVSVPLVALPEFKLRQIRKHIDDVQGEVRYDGYNPLDDLQLSLE